MTTQYLSGMEAIVGYLVVVVVVVERVRGEGRGARGEGVERGAHANTTNTGNNDARCHPQQVDQERLERRVSLEERAA